jgi:hypothetical protein
VPTLPLGRPSTLRTAWLQWPVDLQYYADVVPWARLQKTPNERDSRVIRSCYKPSGPCPAGYLPDKRKCHQRRAWWRGFVPYDAVSPIRSNSSRRQSRRSPRGARPHRSADTSPLLSVTSLVLRFALQSYCVTGTRPYGRSCGSRCRTQKTICQRDIPNRESSMCRFHRSRLYSSGNRCCSG